MYDDEALLVYKNNNISTVLTCRYRQYSILARHLNYYRIVMRKTHTKFAVKEEPKKGIIMKKLLLSALVLTIALSGTTMFAQSPNATATTTATIQAAASIAKDADIDFGAILGDAVTPTIDPTSAVSHSGLLGTPTIGEFTVTAYDGASVVVSLNAATTTLSADAGTTTPITYTPTLADHVTSQGSATSFTSGGTITGFSGTSTHKIFVGGNLTMTAGGGALTGLSSGVYTAAAGAGNIQLNVIYN